MNALSPDLLRIKGKTLIAKNEGDDAYGVTIKLYGTETNGVISIIEQPFEPGLLLSPHVHQNDVWLYVIEGEMHYKYLGLPSTQQPATLSYDLCRRKSERRV
jgi:quercetin dioxygenase-like cupin family protein